VGLGLALDWVLVKLMLKNLKKRVSALESEKSLGQELSRQQMEREMWRLG
jgi:hypothetical protein